jgi:hypothetical protein
MNILKSAVFFMLLMVTTLLFQEKNAEALPSFARQTGLSCFECHTVYPELTPVGREFKLMGYVMSKSSKPYEFPPPLAGMLLTSLSHFDSRLPQGYFNGKWSNQIMSDGNDVLNIPEEANLYYAGRIYGHAGAFIQGTYEGDNNTFHLDITDIRYANITSLGGKTLSYGIDVNNSPTVQDLWNSTPSWGYPFESSEVAPTPAADPIINGALDQQVGGVGLYALWNQLVYAEFAAYHTTKSGIASPLGAGTQTDMVVDDFAPYWRIALQHQWGQHYLEAGTYGIIADIFPDGGRSGPTDRFTDLALDAQYQYLTTVHTVSFETTWIHEKQDRNASFALGETANRTDKLNTFKANIDYYYKSSIGRIGGSAAYFSTTGDTDNLLYAPDPVDGSRTGSPDSDGFIFEADYVPLDKVRFTLQYTLYNKFNGSHSNYDGFGRDASDNNTLYLSVTLLL